MDIVEQKNYGLKAGMKLSDIKKLCENYMLENGADSF